MRTKLFRAQIPAAGSELAGDTAKVLVELFNTDDLESRDVGAIALRLGMQRGVLQHHLDRLREASSADTTGGNYRHGHIYWGLTPEGRRYAVERKLV